MIIQLKTQSHREHRGCPHKLCVLRASVFQNSSAYALANHFVGEPRVPDADKTLEEVL